MLFRAINEIVVHFQSFRNIELWHQGLYFLSAQIFLHQQTGQTVKMINAHPFAHTENFHPNEQSKRYYDHQIVKTSQIQQMASKFISKSFIVKYYEEQIQLNDICHFRIESNLADSNPQISMALYLHFVDLSQRKSLQKMDEREKDLLFREAKVVKTNKYFLNNVVDGIHQFVPLIYDQTYFSLVNMTIHTVCLNYKFRVSDLQLSDFAKLSYSQKLKKIQMNNKLMAESHSKRKISYYYELIKDLGLPDRPPSLRKIENVLVTDFKAKYSSLLSKYNNLFTKVITQNQRKLFGNKLINPNTLHLFQDSTQLLKIPNSDPQQLYNKYRSNNPQQIIQKMLQQTTIIANQLEKLWHCYIDLFRASPRYAVAYLETQYHCKRRDFWSKLLHINKVVAKDLYEGFNEGMKQIQKSLLIQKNKVRVNINVQQQLLLQRRQQFPVLIQNIHYLQNDPQLKQRNKSKNQQNDKDHQGIHLVVFIHGFQGNSFDMRLIKNYVSFLYPQSMFLCATSNQDQTDSDIFQMGERLANQVRTFIAQNFPQHSLSKLSFIGHSLGGVKIRAALPKLLQFKDKFHCLMTFSSPHLGYGINTSSVVEAGMWVLQKMKNSICLKQLSMTDSQIPQQMCLYKLSQADGFQYFKYIFLFSSKQDSYAPFESARIQIAPQFTGDKSKQLHCRMVRNLLKNVKSGVLRRINVIFQIGQKSLDSLIGRTAHIMFLENQQLMKAILYSQPQLLS